MGRTLVGAALLLTILMPTASRAELIRASTGYPSTGWTDGMDSLGATIQAGIGGGFVITSARLNPTSDVILTEMRGIGFALFSQANILNFEWQWDVHSSLQHAIDHPLEGDILHATDLGLASPPTAFGTTMGAQPTYNVTFDLSPYGVILESGTEYWSSLSAVSVTGVDGSWGWMETTETGPSDIGRNQTGAWTFWNNVSGHPTGRAAQDYFAVAVPEPSAFLLGSLAGVATIAFVASRRHSRQKK